MVAAFVSCGKLMLIRCVQICGLELANVDCDLSYHRCRTCSQVQSKEFQESQTMWDKPQITVILYGVRGFPLPGKLQ